MNTYQLVVHQQDVGFLLEAIDLRARFLRDMSPQDVRATDEERARQRDAEQRRQEEEARREALPDPFDEPFDDPFIPDDQIEVKLLAPEKKVISRKAKRYNLLRILRSKNAAELTTAEISRRAGVSYVTAAKARRAFEKKGKK